MKIALLGYGKMGRLIEKVALKRGHSIVMVMDGSTENTDDITLADIAIEFSIPTAAVWNISHCFRNRVPVVCGTTGWLSDYEKVIALCEAIEGAFIYASNYSLGMNIFFELNNHLARMMKNLNQYDASIVDIHHEEKLDAPSGTAITLAEAIIGHMNYEGWHLEESERSTKPSHMAIKAIRSPGVFGTHTVNYNSQIDSIRIKHKAHGREGFALGAVIAAEWLIGKRGVFSMKDVLDLS